MRRTNKKKTKGMNIEINNSSSDNNRNDLNRLKNNHNFKNFQMKEKDIIIKICS